MSWSANQYSKFESERNRPVLDLLALIPTVTVKTAVDIRMRAWQFNRIASC